MDDASTDNTSEVVAAYRDPRIRCLRQDENRGAAAARNRGLREARGRFIAFLDSDDEWLPAKLALQVALLEERPEDFGIVYTGVELVDGSGQREIRMPADRGDLYSRMLLDNVIYGGGSNAMIRRSAMSIVGYFDEGLSAIEDHDYWLRVTRFFRDFRADFVAQPLIRYYNTEQPTGGGVDAPRVSLNFAANLAARDRFFEKYGREMQRSGVAHLFLLESARRQLRSTHGDARVGRRLVLRALWRHPAAWALYLWLPYMLLPSGGRRILRDLERDLRHALAAVMANLRPPRAEQRGEQL